MRSKRVFTATFNLLRHKHYLVFLSTLLAMNAVHANPAGGTVTSGSATITSSGNSTVIQQASQQAILNWSSFNISKGETTTFVQPNASAVALNRISATQGASQIYGQLNANGQVILVNAAGIHFGAGSMVNVAGLIASTSNITDANFLAGKYVFDQASSIRGATIFNEGSIIASQYGLVALLGSNVTNTGLVQAKMGSVVLGTGSAFTLAFDGDQLINFVVNTPAASGGKIVNTGSLIADGGAVMISAQAAQNVLNDVIDMSGITEANSVSQHNGEIILAANGAVNLNGKMTAQGTAAGSTGGTIQITADAVTLANNASVNASGSAGGGVITFNAADAATNSFVNLSYNTNVVANATVAGNGGNISFNTANFNMLASTVSANGVGANNNGGNVTIAANTVNLLGGSFINATGDLVGGNVSVSGVPNANGMANASYINIDSWSGINVNAAGSDSVIAGSTSLYANNVYLFGQITAQDANVNGGMGGQVSLMGQNIYVLPGAMINTNAPFLGGTVTLGGNPLANTTSALVSTYFGSYIGAAAIGNQGFGSAINISANVVSLGGLLDVSGNPYPTISYASSNSSAFNLFCSSSSSNRGTPIITNSGSSGGVIDVTGNTIAVQTGAYLTAAGNVYGGEIILGNSAYTPALTASLTVSAGSFIDAGSYGTANNPIGGMIQMLANNTTVNGIVNASAAASSGSLGGEIQIFAQNAVNIGSFASLSANGDVNGGEILIGGDLNGAGADINAQTTNIAYGSQIAASALTNGPGGEVSVWSQQATTFAGAITATGGRSGGNGGQVEVSSAGTLTLASTASVNVSAPHGVAGSYTNGSPLKTNSAKSALSLASLLAALFR